MSTLQAIALLGSLVTSAAARLAPPARPNVLHVVFDDFRPDLPFYGQPFVHAPNLWNAANKSLVFDRAYCQIAVCSPSRNSFMTGRRPNATLVWNFFNSFREAQCPDTEVGIVLEGPVLRSWQGANPQNTGGAGGCCTSCAGEPACAAWHYRGANKTKGGTCTLLSAVGSRSACAASGGDAFDNPVPCLSGEKGRFPAFTSLPQQFKKHGCSGSQRP